MTSTLPRCSRSPAWTCIHGVCGWWVERRGPNLLGAIHYYIHAVEASPNPERALAGANKLASLAPGAGHIVHMPAHIYIRTGDYEAAVKTNEQAAAIDRSYIK